MSTQAEAFQYRINKLEQELKTLRGDNSTLRDKWVRAVSQENKTRKALEGAQRKLRRIQAALR